MRIRYSREKDGKAVKKALVYTAEEHGIRSADVDSDGVYIIQRLKANGYESYIVGGAVRDLVLGKKPKDFDIVSTASPTRIKKIFRNSRIIGRRFRLVHVYFGDKIFEVSTFRSIKDGLTGNTFGTIEEDVLRRDFTLNALFYDPVEEVVVDYVGGMKDIRERRLKPIIPLSFIFTDDPVRMIRAAKYSAATGCRLSFRLRWKIKKEAPLLASVSPSRLTEEIHKILNSGYCLEILTRLESLGLYEYLQPRAAALMRQDDRFRSAYLESFRALGAGLRDGSAESGAQMAALIRDYLEGMVSWDGTNQESYREAFKAARAFVLPMNPPRLELDNGVRLVFKEHGISLKKSRAFERSRQRSSETTPGEGEGAPPGPQKKRRRRKQRRSSPEHPTDGDGTIR